MASVKSYTTTAGLRYRVIYRKPDHQQTQKRGFTTKKAAEGFLHSIENSKNTGQFIDAAAGRITIGQLSTDWLTGLSHLKPSSARPVQSAWRLHVEPKWGGRPIGTIRPSEVQTWVSQLSNGVKDGDGWKSKPKGATTVLRAYGVLASILDSAVKDRRIPSNPARGLNLPRKTKKKHVYLSHDQVQLLADEAKDKSTLVLLLAYTGLRWGEATGLRVSDLDMLRRRLTVNENAVNVGGKIIVGTPKSHKVRSVPFPAFLTEPIAKLCERKTQDSIVFGSGDDHLRSPDVRDGWFVNAKKRARNTDKTFPELTLHDLRHTAASLAISAGANVKAIQRMLGHASAAMTLDIYADLFDDDLDAVATALNQAKTNSTVAKVLPKRPNSGL